MIRYTIPTKLDKGNYGEICKVIEDQKTSYYIQLSKDKDHFLWISIGDFLQKIFLQNLLDNQDFLDSCLKKWEEQQGFSQQKG